MFWITNAFTVATILSAVACTWHLTGFLGRDLAWCRLRKRYPNVKIV